MSKKVLLFLVVIILFAVALLLLLFRNQQKSTLTNPQILKQEGIKQQLVPSQTLTEYSDPSGFKFSYPDNLSIDKNETEDPNSYADLQLSSKEVSGSIILRIVDTKLKTIDEWVKLNKSSDATLNNIKLGNLEAVEISLKDRLLLGALDQGVLFTLEIPRVEEVFWMEVYNKILSDFSFEQPSNENSQSNTTSQGEIIFEGEEVVE